MAGREPSNFKGVGGLGPLGFGKKVVMKVTRRGKAQTGMDIGPKFYMSMIFVKSVGGSTIRDVTIKVADEKELEFMLGWRPWHKRTVACVITFLKDQNERFFQGYRGGHWPEDSRRSSIAMQPCGKGAGSRSMRQRAAERQTFENLCFASDNDEIHKLLRSGEKQGICQDL
jgi:hypothetical protein